MSVCAQDKPAYEYTGSFPAEFKDVWCTMEDFFLYLSDRVGLEPPDLSDSKQVAPVIAPEVFIDKAGVLVTEELIYVLRAASLQYLGDRFKSAVIRNEVVGK